MNNGVLDTSNKRLQTRIIIHTIVTIQVYSPHNVLRLLRPQTFTHNQYIFCLWVTSLFIPMKSSHLEGGGSTLLQITGKTPIYYMVQTSKRRLDVRGSVHHSIIHIENPTRCNSVSKFYFMFIWSSTCFGRHTAHYQEPKTALAASGFAYVGGCQTCSHWTLSGSIYTLPDNVHQLHVQQPSTYAIPEAASAVLGSW